MTTHNNYISPLPPQEQQALYRWYTVSVCLIIGCIIIFALINSYQYITIKKLQNSYQARYEHLKQLQHETQQYEPLLQEYNSLQARLNKIDAITHQTHNPIGHLQKISEHIPGNVCLTEFSCAKKKKISFHGYAQTPACALTFLAKLAQLPEMNHLQLTSLHPTQFPETNRTWYQFQAKKLYR